MISPKFPSWNLYLFILFLNDNLPVCLCKIFCIYMFDAVFRSHSCWSALPSHAPGVPGESVLLWTLPHLGAHHHLRYSRNGLLRHPDENRQPCRDHTDHTEICLSAHTHGYTFYWMLENATKITALCVLNNWFKVCINHNP